MRKRMLYYVTTIISALGVGLSYSWWTYFFGPDIDDRGLYLFFNLIPGLFISCLGLSLACLLLARAPERAAIVLITIDSWVAYGFVTCIVRLFVLVNGPNTDRFFAGVNLIWWIMAIAGSAIIWWCGIRRLLAGHGAVNSVQPACKNAQGEPIENNCTE